MSGEIRDEAAPDHAADGRADGNGGPQSRGGSGGTQSPGFPDRRYVDLSRDPTPGRPDHALPDGAERDPLIDMTRDPNPGIADHALPEEADER